MNLSATSTGQSLLLSQRAQQPKRLFHQSQPPPTRHQLLEQLRGPTPGPGSYNTEKYRNTLGANVTIKSRHEAPPPTVTPGPGSYELAAAHEYVRPRTADVRLRSRRTQQTDQNTLVGPGSYDLRRPDGARRGTSFAGRYAPKQDVNRAGFLDITQGYAATHKTAPHCSMTFSERMPPPRREMGPGFAYNHQQQHVSAAACTFSRAGRGSAQVSDTPGPGDYELGRTAASRGPRFSFAGRWECGERF